MTETNTINPDTSNPDTINPDTTSTDAGTDSAPNMTMPQMPDPRPMLAIAASISQQIIAGVRPDQVDLPTPCDEFTVSELTAHVVFALDRITAVGRRDPMPATDFQIDSVGNAPADWAATHRALSIELGEAWADDARLSEMADMEWAVLPAPVALSIYANELLVHGWDLAVATGQEPDWNDEAAAFALAAMRMGLPAEGREQAPFNDVVDIGADAPMIDQLVAWNGRTPA